jgi:hypothetical protein
MMSLLIFLLGAFVGFFCSLAFFLGGMIDKMGNPADNLNRRLEQTAKSLAAQKGAIIEPKSDELIAMEETFERNDREGKDTPIGEIEGDEQV